ncbi:MAG: hypothetical protein CM1200mP4_5580 [Rhodospirillaceae bacterium]|nr:MAG: hypothetical protein CM1200mP4_5580 [Rhodospirillaceae bacterium]
MAALGKQKPLHYGTPSAWKKIKTRGENPPTLAILRELPAVREEGAQTLRVPRKHVIGDQPLTCNIFLTTNHHGTINSS